MKCYIIDNIIYLKQTIARIKRYQTTRIYRPQNTNTRCTNLRKGYTPVARGTITSTYRWGVVSWASIKLTNDHNLRASISIQTVLVMTRSDTAPVKGRWRCINTIILTLARVINHSTSHGLRDFVNCSRPVKGLLRLICQTNLATFPMTVAVSTKASRLRCGYQWNQN